MYSRAAHFEFLNYDDPAYVTDNPYVRHGLTWDGFVWAFTSFHAANWSPITWLSHMADSQWFGLRSGWHHETNVLLHALAALLLFVALKRLTGARWPSAFVAFIFALHPLHVESVAWVAERKDVLCAVFWFLALWLYALYVERPGKLRYLLVLAAFCLGLMAKPMIVTLPFVLLLLDVWPLRRASLASVREKIPFFVGGLGSALVTFLAQREGHAVRSLGAIPLGTRLANAVVAYATYLLRMFWPANLAVFYPYPLHLPAWQVIAAAAVLAAITVAVVRRVSLQPYLTIGWFWYLATLVPVIGLIQVGGQSSADRYTYVPMVGIAIMAAWGAAEITKRSTGARTAIIAAAAAICLAYSILTSVQLGYWRDSETLFQHAVDVTNNNALAHNNLANYYLVHMRDAEAMPHIREALRIRPDYPEAHTNLALVLKRSGKFQEAEHEYQLALSLQSANVDTHSGYGALLVAEGRNDDALREFSAAVALRPDYAAGHYNLARVMAALGRQDEAIDQFKEAVRLQPDDPAARHGLGFAFLGRGRMDEALAQFEAEARLLPDDAAVHYALGSLLTSAGRFDEAIAQFSEALRIKPDLAGARRGLEMAEGQRAKSGARF